MKIGIFGAGAVGGFLGAKLAAAGQDVHFIARDNQMKAMRLNGLTVKSEAFGNTFLAHPQVTDDPEDVGTCDVVFMTVKLYDTDEAIKIMGPMVGAGTVLVSFQNGLTAAEPLMKAFGPEMVLGGVAYTMSYIETPGIIHQIGRWGRFVIGRFAPGATAHGEAMAENAPQLRAESIKDILVDAGLEASVSDDIRTEIWKKFAYLAPLSGMAALLRMPLGEILADSDTRGMLEAAIMEVIRVSTAKGLKLEPTLKDTIMKMFETMPAEMGTSMLTDMLQGERLEVPWLSGMVSRFGHESNIPTPMHDAIYTALKLWS
ncbi:MAG: ketopantoate reductase family protein [Rhodospirillaceae bacterium]|nr:ketopantoate reductase family protein [Rhodospirillaceae bacterium]